MLLHGLKKIDPYLPSGFSVYNELKKDPPCHGKIRAISTGPFSVSQPVTVITLRGSPCSAGVPEGPACQWNGNVLHLSGGTVPMVVQHGEVVNGNGGETLTDIMVIYH